MTSQKNYWKIFFSIFSGGALEYFDFALYAAFAGTMAPLFFPSHDPFMSIFSGFFIFALGHLVRPLGGYFFGRMGDKYGRKIALSFSILGMGIPTFLIGCLPTYESIGIYAPILLATLRMFQGFSMGGEFNGSMIFALEHTEKSKHGFTSSLIQTSAYVGVLLANLMGALFTTAFMPSWSWRLAFILGSMIGILSFWMRRALPESPEFTSIKPQEAYQPLREILKRKKTAVFFICMISAFIGAFTNIGVWLSNYAFKNILGIQQSNALLITCLAPICTIIFSPLFGRLADRYSPIRIILYSMPGSSIGLYLSLEYFLHSGIGGILFTVIIAGIGAASVTSYGAIYQTLFSVSERYRAISVAQSIAIAIFGGLSSNIYLLIYQYTGSLSSVALYPLSVSLFFMAAFIFISKRQSVKKLSDESLINFTSQSQETAVC